MADQRSGVDNVGHPQPVSLIKYDKYRIDIMIKKVAYQRSGVDNVGHPQPDSLIRYDKI